MRRRHFITLIGSAASWPVALRAQQKSMPVIGFLGSFPPIFSAQIALEQAAFREGLRETGYVEGQNVAIVYGRGEGHIDRLPALAAALVSRKVDVIVTQGGDEPIFAAKNATSTIPILFHSSSDPIANGFIASLARPGGNLTGVSLLSVDLIPKRLELMLELVPQARLIAVLHRPGIEDNEAVIGEMQETMRAKQVDLRVLKIRAESEVDSAFETLMQLKASGVVTDGAFRRLIAPLALRHGIPSIAPQRDFPIVDGGLLSYGHSNTAVYRLKGIYAGKILQGAKASDLPVQQPTQFDLVINLKTAKALGLTVPQALLARADEVIE